jgi:hypothetical protein
VSRQHQDAALARDLAPASIDEPCPCDECRHHHRCAATEEACVAFRVFVCGDDWGLMPTQPDALIGARLLKS